MGGENQSIINTEREEKMNRPYVSIIVPIYNVQQYLHRSLTSLLNQSLKNIEIILINDGSTDRSHEICKEYAKIDSRIKLITQKNSGVSIARNVGIENATADYIVFMDPDDEVNPQMYELLYNEIKNSDYDLIMCNYYKCFNGQYIPIVLDYPSRLENNEEILILIFDMFANQIYGEETVMGSSCRGIYKKEMMLKYNIKFPQNICLREDLVFMIEYLLKCRKISIKEECLYYYFINSNSAVTGYKEDLWTNSKQVCIYLQSLIPKNQLNRIGEQRLVNLWVHCAEECLFNEMNPLNSQDKKIKINHINKIINYKQIQLYLNDISLKKVKLRKKIIIMLMRLGNPKVMYYYLVINKFMKNILSKFR